MSEILLNDPVSKQEFIDEVNMLKSDIFDGSVECFPSEMPEMNFDHNCTGVIGRDPYGDLFLMDPNDLLGVREEVVGDECNLTDDSLTEINKPDAPKESNAVATERPPQRRRKNKPKPINIPKTESSGVSDQSEADDDLEKCKFKTPLSISMQKPDLENSSNGSDY